MLRKDSYSRFGPEVGLGLKHRGFGFILEQKVVTS